ncbi:hypothetical protein MMC28_011102 [Mycoblastus sanguinarius]|nr:hypothetical protein [Mycoblastus sanguinarius]
MGVGSHRSGSSMCDDSSGQASQQRSNIPQPSSYGMQRWLGQMPRDEPWSPFSSAKDTQSGPGEGRSVTPAKQDGGKGENNNTGDRRGQA